tara:strand:- start:10711 stop:11952 length:1242 start_codon:yes stop_codon:yes gene_type:complete
MANTVTVGRLTFTSPGSLSFSGSTNQPNNSVNISGKLAVDDLDDAKSLRDELISMSKQDCPVAFTYTGDSTLKGYCYVESSSIDISRYSIGGIDYNIDLLWLGKPGEVNLESHFSGALIENSHSITSTTNQMHSPPRQHYTYYHTGTLTNTSREQLQNQSTIIKTGGNLRDSNATYNVDPENYYEGAVEIKIKDYHDQLRLRAGRDSDNKPTDAIVENGLIKLTVLGDNTSQCRFTTHLYDPDSDDYTSAQTWAISATGSETEWQSWQSIQILKNEPQIATIRLTTHYDATNKDGRLVFDITMKRGARHLEFVASQWQVQQLNVKAVTSLAGTNDTGYIKATSSDGQGNKYIIGTPSTYTADTSNLGISVSGSTAVKGFIGGEIGTASGANTSDSIRDQYIDSIFETVRVVKS